MKLKEVLFYLFIFGMFVFNIYLFIDVTEGFNLQKLKRVHLPEFSTLNIYLFLLTIPSLYYFIRDYLMFFIQLVVNFLYFLFHFLLTWNLTEARKTFLFCYFFLICIMYIYGFYRIVKVRLITNR